MKKQISKFDKGKVLHFSRPPRMEGKARNAGMRPVRKQKRAA